MMRRLAVRSLDWLAQQLGDLSDRACAKAERLDGRDLTRFERQNLEAWEDIELLDDAAAILHDLISTGGVMALPYWDRHRVRTVLGRIEMEKQRRVVVGHG